MSRLAARRAASQLLHRPTGRVDPADLARAFAGAQAQEKRAGLLQFRARNRRLTAAEIERARVEERSLTRGWLMRGTVHLVATDDYRWMLPLWSERHSAHARRRLGRLGMPASTQERALSEIRRALAADGNLSRAELIERLRGRGIAVTPETRLHLMFVPVVEGWACIGPDRGGSGSLVLARDWLSKATARPRERALAELARRYFGAFAPASERDFAYWAGLPLRDCRRGLREISSEIVVAGEDPARGSALLRLAARPVRAPHRPLVRLLGGFDTYLLGYASRRHAVSETDERRFLPGGGVLRPTVLVDGRIVGSWRSKRSGERLEVTIEPFGELEGGVEAAIRDEVADVGRFEGLSAELA